MPALRGVAQPGSAPSLPSEGGREFEPPRPDARSLHPRTLPPCQRNSEQELTRGHIGGQATSDGYPLHGIAGRAGAAGGWSGRVSGTPRRPRGARRPVDSMTYRRRRRSPACLRWRACVDQLVHLLAAARGQGDDRLHVRGRVALLAGVAEPDRTFLNGTEGHYGRDDRDGRADAGRICIPFTKAVRATPSTAAPSPSGSRAATHTAPRRALHATSAARSLAGRRAGRGRARPGRLRCRRCRASRRPGHRRTWHRSRSARCGASALWGRCR